MAREPYAQGARAYAGAATRRARLAVLRRPPRRWRFRGRGAPELRLAPPDLRTADPTLAGDFYAGRFAFAGHIAETRGLSPFAIIPPSPAWERELHAFGWLRHMRAAQTALAQSNGRTLVDDWLKERPSHTHVAFDPSVTARRVLSWLAQSPLLLEDGDPAFYRRFSRSLVAHARYLRAAASLAEPGLERMVVLIALASAGLSIEGEDKLARSSLAELDRELVNQILPDGGHVGRNPGSLIEILLDLLPLREAMVSRGFAPSPALVSAIERMMPMLRFFRHGDGAMAQMNGMGATPRGELATVLSHDESRGSAVPSARYSAYERIEAGDACLLIDVGGPPPPAYSRDAHAGALAFEFSHGAERLIVNCGAPGSRHPAFARTARMTAAQSSATINDASQSRFLGSAPDAILVAGPRKTSVDRVGSGAGEAIEATHDGYRARFGIVHARRIALARNGRRLAGEDRFEGDALVRPLEAVLRFHMPPGVGAQPDGAGFRLNTPGGQAWRFVCDAGAVLEESANFSELHGVRPSVQIAVALDLNDARAARWSFTLLDGDGGPS